MTTYHRFTNGDSPDNGTGYMMFAAGNPERVSHYGTHHWTVTDDDMMDVVDSYDIEDRIASVLSEHYPDVVLSHCSHGSDTIDEVAARLAAESSPADIVNSAGVWDSQELVEIIYDQIIQPEYIRAVRTPDGIIVFDRSMVQ